MRTKCYATLCLLLAGCGVLACGVSGGGLEDGEVLSANHPEDNSGESTLPGEGEGETEADGEVDPPPDTPTTTGPGGAGGDDGSGGAGGAGGDPDPSSSSSGGGPPPTSFDEVCYPGASYAYDVCLPLVPHSSSWGSAYSYPASNSVAYDPPLRYVDLTTADPNLQLVPNFSLDEVMQLYKGDFGVYQVHMTEKLQTLRNNTGGALSVNSGYRSPGYNAGVGGASKSRHMFGDAADMASSAVSLNGLRNACEALGADYIGMYTNHVHCDWRYAAKDPAFYASMNIVAPAHADEHDHESTPEHVGELFSDGQSFAAEASGFDEGEPYREWRAYDATDQLIEVVATNVYQAPAAAVRIEVMIGGQIELHAWTDAPAEFEQHPATFLAD